VIAYVDSSVFLRILLDQPMELPSWRTISLPLTNRLLQVESCRTLDRLRHSKLMTDDEYAAKLFDVERFLDIALVFEVDKRLLFAASRRLPVRLATLDAIHLATAERFRYEFGEPFLFATHDAELAAAARASGFDVIGSTA
jgi:predicted nucleic acid-binding protein